MSSSRDAATDAGRITRVGVVGAGQMGSGIAEVCARAHVDVLVWESTRELTTAGRSRILQSLDRGHAQFAGEIRILAERLLDPLHVTLGLPHRRGPMHGIPGEPLLGPLVKRDPGVARRHVGA